MIIYFSREKTIYALLKTVSKNSSVFISGILQENGKSVVDFTEEVTYKIDVPKGEAIIGK